MKKLLRFLAIVTISIMVIGCATMTSPVVNSIDIKSTDFSKPMKTGEACRTYVLWFGPFGDASVVQAAQEGKISKVEAVDYKSAWYVFINQFCIVAYGE